MNEIYIDWSMLITWVGVFRVFCFGLGMYWLIDMICLSDFLDPERTSQFVKIGVGIMAGAAMMLILSSIYGNRDMLMISISILFLLGSIGRFVVWIKGGYLSDFLAGKNIKSKGIKT